MLLEGLKDQTTMRMSQLAESVGTTPPTVTKLIRDLEDKGLITKSPDQEDGRASIISLTDRGREVAASIFHARQESLRRSSPTGAWTTWRGSTRCSSDSGLTCAACLILSTPGLT